MQGARGIEEALTFKDHTWWIACLCAGALTIALSIGFGLIPNISGCGDDGGAGSIIAFELVRTPADVAALFGQPPCTGPFREAMRLATWIDALVFIPVYSAFLIAGLLALRPNGRIVALAGIAAVLFAALFDEIEGVQLFRIMTDLPGSQPIIDLLILLVRGKFALLGIGALAIGWLLAKPGGAGRITGLLVTLGGALTMVGLYGDEYARFLTLGSALSWLTLLGVAAVRSLRGRRAAHS